MKTQTTQEEINEVLHNISLVNKEIEEAEKYQDDLILTIGKDEEEFSRLTREVAEDLQEYEANQRDNINRLLRLTQI